MSVIVPPIYTPIDDQEVSYKRPVSEETVRKLCQNINLLGSLAIIGSIRAVALNQPGVPVPATDQFQLCDGAKITDPVSPLRSVIGTDRFAPNLKDKYIRGAANATTNTDTGDLPSGGSATRDLSHTHTTGNVCSPFGIIGDAGTERRAYETACHNHGVDADLTTPDPIELGHQQIAFFLKIN
jgi:hypothetical protein